jgi:hypothetical protein
MRGQHSAPEPPTFWLVATIAALVALAGLLALFFLFLAT